jgi:hypothetical protein
MKTMESNKEQGRKDEHHEEQYLSRRMRMRTTKSRTMEEGA